VLVSKDTRDALQRTVELRSLPPQAVKGDFLRSRTDLRGNG